ncbi:MAG: protein phosphatase 2C domain-containing protein, partial [Rhodoferax sp.]|nr:protein phosphatase 2C domain-containing protein [Rhodoferax sp.]
MMFTHSTLSQAGGRKVNEDAANCVILSDTQGCWVLADGLGGHGGGDVAANLAVNTMLAAYQNKPEFSAGQIDHMLGLAHHAILQGQQETDRLSAMRSTAVVLLLQGTQAWWAHVGDSRLYRFAHGNIAQQTKDHSVPQV